MIVYSKKKIIKKENLNFFYYGGKALIKICRNYILLYYSPIYSRRIAYY